MENAYNLFINKLFMKADLGKIPLAGTFELTSRCTLDCKMCYIHKGICNKEAQSREKSTEWWLKLAEECKKRGTLNLLLTGGEPLIRNDFKDIYKVLSFEPDNITTRRPDRLQKVLADMNYGK